MSILACTSYYEVTPTMDEIKREISDIVGLTEIKHQLETIMDVIIDAKKREARGFTVIPPKPFHMVFVGNNGTGKSTVARIIGKLFYLAGTLSSFRVTEIRGDQKFKDVSGGVLRVNIDEDVSINSQVLDDIMTLMDEGGTSIIFMGNSKALNRFMKFKELYKRFSAGLRFDDLNCEELATIVLKKANSKGEDSLIDGLQLDASCTTDTIAQIITEGTPQILLSMLNAHLLDQMLIEAKKICLTHEHGNDRGDTIMSLNDLALGVQNGAQVYMKLLNL